MSSTAVDIGNMTIRLSAEHQDRRFVEHDCIHLNMTIGLTAQCQPRLQRGDNKQYIPTPCENTPSLLPTIFHLTAQEVIKIATGK